MRTTAYLLLSSLFFSCAINIAAQDSSPLTKQRVKLKHKSRIGFKYDKFKDQTTVRVGPYFMTGGMEYAMTNSQFEMIAAFSVPGQKLVKPVGSVTLAFESKSKEWKFLNERNLYALVNGERLNLGEAVRDSDVRRGGVSEFLSVSVPYETFIKIANGKTVEMKLGEKEFKLKDEHLEGFRDLASRMVP